MGFFGTHLFDGKAWSQSDPDEEPELAPPWLFVDIHDSDWATIRYQPAGPGSGVAYLGYTPRIYFEDDSASEPTDVLREAEGLTAWWAAFHRRTDNLEREAKAAELRSYLASHDPVDEEDDEEDDADAFVEIKAARFLEALGLPVPDELAG